MDEKQKKMLIIVAIVLVVLIIVTSVLLILNRQRTTPQVETEENGKPPLTEQSVELSYWGLWEPESVMQPVIDEFQDMYPNIMINYSQQSFTAYETTLYTRLQQAAGTGEPAPDIFRIHNTWTPKYYQYLYPLPSDLMNAQEYSENFYSTIINDFTAKDGNIYAMPWSIDGLMVFYNKSILEQAGVERPPEDWDSFFELAQRLTRKDATGRIVQSGLAMGTSRNIRHSAEIISYLLLLEGVEVIDSTRTRVSLDTPAGQRVFRTYTDFARGDNAIWSPGLRTDLEMFFTGELAMMIAPSWRAFDIIEAAPSVEFDTAPLPQLKQNEQNIFFSTYWGEAVNKTTPHPLEAWAFVKFLAEREQQIKLYSNASRVRAFGEPYSLVELNSEMAGQPYVSALAEMAPFMKSVPIGDEQIFHNAIDEAITDIVENGRNISTSLKEAEQAINSRIAQTNR
jgi:ABC-type glycerol-3-phosphate transport system substrate-binding protein